MNPVDNFILKPMQSLFPAPLHLRHDADAMAKALASYRKALEPFNAETLRQAWTKVISDNAMWVWPPPGLIAEACRAIAPRHKEPSEEEQCRSRAREQADAYTARFMKTTQVAKLARREGWAGQLRAYVSDAAWVQAQLICGVKNIGWNTQLSGVPRAASSQAAFAEYRKTIAGPVERGQIRVVVPKDQVRTWQQWAAQSGSISPHSPEP